MINRATCLLLILFIAGCTKDKTLQPPVQPPQPTGGPALLGHLDSLAGEPGYYTKPPLRVAWPMIKTETYCLNNNLPIGYTYYYDAWWRLIEKEEMNGGIPTYTYSYSYTSGAVLCNGSVEMYLNAQGLASWMLYGNYNLYRYSFNGNRNLIKTDTDYGDHDYYYNGNGNMSSSSSSSYSPPYSSNTTSTYTYNSHTNTTGNYNHGKYYWGRSSANLMETAASHSSTSAGGWHDYFATYHYTYNDSGWVSHVDVLRSDITPGSTGQDTTYQTDWYDYTYY